MMDYLALIGAAAFSLCVIPQAYACYKRGSSLGMTWSFLLLWFIGEVCFVIYYTYKDDIPLLINYVVNGLSLSVIIFYKLRGIRYESQA